MAEIRHIISDLDGTLVDTFEANFAAYRDVLAEYGFELTREKYHAAFGQRIDGLLRSLAGDNLLPHLAEIKQKKAIYYPQHFDLLRLNTSLVGFYRMFQSSGGHLALSSTASAANIKKVLEAVGCMDLFEYVVTGEMVKNAKPDPDCYLAVSEYWKIIPQNILVFEDTDIGILAAKSAGMQVIRVK